MPHWTLIDSRQGIYEETFTVEKNAYRISKRRLRGGLSDGVDVVEIDNGKLSLTVLPTRGMGIWRGRCGDVELKWDSPVTGPVHPSFVPLASPTGWLEGFDEWLVRCGLESNGSPEFDADGQLRYPLHGRIANLPAQQVSLDIDAENNEISLAGKVVEAKLFFKKLQLESTLTTKFGSSEFVVKDTVTNLSAEPGTFQLLYHINTGRPFASPGGRAVIPFETMAPRTPAAVENLPAWDTLDPETPGCEEVVFFFEPAYDSEGRCKTMLINAQGDRGLTIAFDRSFPLFSFWKARLANADGYVCGMEPSVNLPNNRSFEESRGRIVPLEPGESRSFELRFEILHDKNAVEQAEAAIRSIGGARTVLPVPQKEWTP